MSSAAKYKLGALLNNEKYSVPVHKTLEKMGHPHPPTPTQTENSISYGLVNKNIHPKSTKPMDTCFHLLQYRE